MKLTFEEELFYSFLGLVALLFAALLWVKLLYPETFQIFYVSDSQTSGWTVRWVDEEN